MLGATTSSSGFRSAGLEVGEASTTVRGNGGATRAGLEKHRRLFTFVPSKSARRQYKGKTPKTKMAQEGSHHMVQGMRLPAVINCHLWL